MATPNITAFAGLLLFGASTAVAQSLVLETQGLPISLHQAQVTGLPSIEEQSPEATLSFAGMPASPHQLAVLTSRSTASIGGVVDHVAPIRVETEQAATLSCCR